jgi:hypothetical protein
VLELVATNAALVTIIGDERAMAAVDRLEGTFVCPVAPDERLVIAPSEALKGVVTISEERATVADSDALIVDTSDGWAVWTLHGDGIRAAFARLSGLRLPGVGFTQGDVTRVPVKLIVDSDRLHLIVAAMWRRFLHDRIVDRCGALGLTERAGPVPFSPPGRAP